MSAPKPIHLQAATVAATYCRSSLLLDTQILYSKPSRFIRDLANPIGNVLCYCVFFVRCPPLKISTTENLQSLFIRSISGHPARPINPARKWRTFAPREGYPRGPISIIMLIVMFKDKHLFLLHFTSTADTRSSSSTTIVCLFHRDVEFFFCVLLIRFK